MIRLTIPHIDNHDVDQVENVLRSGYLVQGIYVEKFEKLVKEFVDVSHAVATSNCTASLQVALMSIGVESGDIIIVPAYSWISTANVIELCGAKPFFVDIDPKTFNICIDKLEIALKYLKNTSGKVKAIIPVHTFGLMANMHEIISLAKKYELYVIEDAACAIGASIEEKHAGTWGDAGCFSFHPRKIITTGEGGMIVTNQNDIDLQSRILRNHGQYFEKGIVDFVRPGFNFRMTDFQGALGCSQMEKLDSLLEHRIASAFIYNELFGDFGDLVETPYVPCEYKHVYQSYVVKIKNIESNNILDIISSIKKKGVEVGVGTINMPMTSYYRKKYNYSYQDFPNTAMVSQKTIALPVFCGISESQQREIVKCVVQCVEGNA